MVRHAMPTSLIGFFLLTCCGFVLPFCAGRVNSPCSFQPVFREGIGDVERESRLHCVLHSVGRTRNMTNRKAGKLWVYVM